EPDTRTFPPPEPGPRLSAPARSLAAPIKLHGSVHETKSGLFSLVDTYFVETRRLGLSRAQLDRRYHHPCGFPAETFQVFRLDHRRVVSPVGSTTYARPGVGRGSSRTQCCSGSVARSVEQSMLGSPPSLHRVSLPGAGELRSEPHREANTPGENTTPVPAPSRACPSRQWVLFVQSDPAIGTGVSTAGGCCHLRDGRNRTPPLAGLSGHEPSTCPASVGVSAECADLGVVDEVAGHLDDEDGLGDDLARRQTGVFWVPRIKRHSWR
ncbi:hypothetical protein SAMN06265174_1181, partial [Dietzia kunjamensis subsp. schimae]